ncbi:MAG: PH domain-containing protein [Gemmatimonadaceae bacterium]|nr:PH domain-containing protein [Gemmatimonadaceae bacterium]
MDSSEALMLPDGDAHLVPVSATTVQAITRPDPQLWKLYLIYSALANVAFPIAMLSYYFLYRTLRFRFDDEGVAVSHGLLWRRETYLTYARIQDIHVTRNIFERWLGIGTVKIQTASGSAAATEAIPGLRAYEDVRNWLYARMRGHRPSLPATEANTLSTAGSPDATYESLQIQALAGIRDELRAVRQLLESPARGADDV